MKESQLRELEAICERATPGPWRHVCTITRADVVVDTVASASLPIAEFNSTNGADDATDQEQADAAFAATARTALPEALREVERLRGALMSVRGFLRGVARRPELGKGAADLLNEADDITNVLEADGE